MKIYYGTFGTGHAFVVADNEAEAKREAGKKMGLVNEHGDPYVVIAVEEIDLASDGYIITITKRKETKDADIGSPGKESQGQTGGPKPGKSNKGKN